tara:strand:+ start:17 stop:289 length:273 start_codon:yes stop_codon:yes gene_type:complete
MVVGDFINGVTLGTTFQPAAGVTVCITSAAWWNGYTEFTDGVNTGRITIVLDSTQSYSGVFKMFIDNTNFLNFTGGAVAFYRNYSGVQVA